MVAIEVIVAIDQHRRFRCRDDVSQIGLSKVGEAQVLGTLDVDPIVSEIRSSIEHDHIGLFAHGKELIEAQDALIAVGFDFSDEFFEVLVTDPGFWVCGWLGTARGRGWLQVSDGRYDARKCVRSGEIRGGTIGSKRGVVRP